MFIFVFEGISYGRADAILAEFGPVPNAPSDVDVSVVAAAKPAGEPPVPVQPVTAPDKIEFGGPQGPEPTRFGDWEKNGRCIDF